MKMPDEELLAAISAAEEAALGTLQGEIATDRADAIDRYLGKPYGDEQKGRSQVVSRDISDVVEGVAANVLKPFVGGDEVVKFEPRGPEDVEQAQQETDYVNFVCLERNNGFLTLNSAVKDALLLRAGYVKCGWAKRNDIALETYEGLSDDEVAIIVKDKEVQIVAHDEYPDPYGVALGATPPVQGQELGGSIPPPAAMLHNLKLRRAQTTEYVEILPLPPDEILISSRLRIPSVQEADFVQTRHHLMLSDVRQMGYDVPDDISDESDAETIEGYARQRFGQRGDIYDDETQDRSRRLVLFKETWIRIDRDGDGVAELRRVCQVGQNILADDEADIIPIACFSAVLMQHQHLGLSVYDLVKDLAQIKTAVMRQYLDNLYQANNQRSAVDINRVNLDDFLVSRPGGVVRVEGEPSTAIFPLVAPNVGAGALQGLEYLDSVRENRTGYTRYAQGMESDSLINKTATGLTQAMSQSQMRLEMIARTIAETGVRDLFRIVHALTLKHSTKSEKVRLRNQWVEVNPREWVKRFDLSISVGLGTSTAQQQMQNLMLLGQAQEKAMALGLVKPRNVYNVLKKLANSAGFKNPEEFFTEPQKDPQTGEDVPPPQAKDPLVQAKEVETQGKLQLAQVEQQGKGMELQHQAQVDRERMQGEFTLQQTNDQRQIEIKKYEIEKNAELEVFKARLKVESEERIALIKIEADERIAAQQAEVARETAYVGADAQVSVAGLNEEKKSESFRAKQEEKQAEKKATSEMRELMSLIAQAVQKLEAANDAPREVVRDASGRVSGVRVGGRTRNVRRGPDGRVAGVE